MKNFFKFFEKILTKIYCRFLPNQTSTSLSDNQAYPQVCIDAVNSARYFNKFRRNPVYTGIVETVSQRQGQEYLDIYKNNKFIMDKIGEFKKNEDWGGVVKYEYPGIGSFSPTTLRYIKVLSDFSKYFVNLDGKNICEIGVGYGGQCRIVNALYTPSSYCLVDIKPALLLSQKYLDNFAMKSVLDYKTMNELGYKQYDLCVSNYAFSELPRFIQDIYLKKVILNSKSGYIIYSDNFTPSSFNSYRVDELLRIIPGSVRLDEIPHTGPNYLILWGHEKGA